MADVVRASLPNAAGYGKISLTYEHNSFIVHSAKSKKKGRNKVKKYKLIQWAFHVLVYM
jgi:hypothetical protein